MVPGKARVAGKGGSLCKSRNAARDHEQGSRRARLCGRSAALHSLELARQSCVRAALLSTRTVALTYDELVLRDTSVPPGLFACLRAGLPRGAPPKPLARVAKP